jgi:hypothetical protein
MSSALRIAEARRSESWGCNEDSIGLTIGAIRRRRQSATCAVARKHGHQLWVQLYEHVSRCRERCPVARGGGATAPSPGEGVQGAACSQVSTLARDSCRFDLAVECEQTVTSVTGDWTATATTRAFAASSTCAQHPGGTCPRRPRTTWLACGICMRCASWRNNVGQSEARCPPWPMTS